jgi:hypothetical protein
MMKVEEQPVENFNVTGRCSGSFVMFIVWENLKC